MTIEKSVKELVIETFVKELLEDAMPIWEAMESVQNFEDLEAKAEEMATAEYMESKDIPHFKSVYAYIMQQCCMGEKELIKNVLADASLLKIAKESNLPKVAAYARSSLMKTRNWFENREDAEETAAYNFFDQKLRG